MTSHKVIMVILGHSPTLAKCEVYVNKNPVTAIVDSGAATSLISKPLMKKLGLQPNKSSNMIIVNVNGNSTRIIGEITDLSISINYLKVPANVAVIEHKDDLFILGNEWLNRSNANIDYKGRLLTIHYKGRKEKVPISYFSEGELEEEESEELIEDSEDEIEESYAQEIPIYFSDISSGEDEWKDTPTYVMNIIYSEKGVWLSQRTDPHKVMYQQWQCPGGKVEKGESSIQATLRETLEE